jgi:hypothetical protein
MHVSTTLPDYLEDCWGKRPCILLCTFSVCQVHFPSKTYLLRNPKVKDTVEGHCLWGNTAHFVGAQLPGNKRSDLQVLLRTSSPWSNLHSPPLQTFWPCPLLWVKRTSLSSYLFITHFKGSHAKTSCYRFRVYLTQNGKVLFVFFETGFYCVV